MTAVVNKHRIRHGHMVNITREIMLQGMRANFLEVDALSQRLVEIARMTSRVTCRTPRGTDYVAELSPKLNWLKTGGIITRDKWGNLPAAKSSPRRSPATGDSWSMASSEITSARSTATSKRRRSRSR
jgi:leucyl aminopeptidase (aminopeptidase T)